MLCLIQQRVGKKQNNGWYYSGGKILPKYYKETNYKIMELVFSKASRNFF